MAETPVGERSEVEKWMVDALAAVPLEGDFMMTAAEFFAPHLEGIAFYERPNGERVYLGICEG